MVVKCLVTVDNNPPEELIFEYAPRVGDHVMLPGAIEPPHPIVRVAHRPTRPNDARGQPSVAYFVSRETFLYRVHTGAIEGYSDVLKGAINRKPGKRGSRKKTLAESLD
jgi:hypothetical protein